MIEEWLAGFPGPARSALAVLEKHRVPCAPILTLNEAVSAPTLARARHGAPRRRPAARGVRYPGPASEVFRAGPTADGTVAPICSAQHNEEVLKEIAGLSRGRDRRALRTASAGAGYGTEESGGLSRRAPGGNNHAHPQPLRGRRRHIAFPGHRGRVGRAAARQPALEALPSDRARLPQGRLPTTTSTGIRHRAASTSSISTPVCRSRPATERAVSSAPGEIVLVEDVSGKGHLSKAVGGKIRHCLFIPIE